MSNLHHLLQWWNLLFVLPLVLGALFSVVTALGFISAEHETETHSEAGHDVEASAEHGDMEHSADTHIEHGDVAHEAHAEHTHDAGHGDYDHHESVLTQILEAFGIGRGVPISVMLPFCMMLWGVLGLVSNQALHPVLRFPAVYVWLSALVSLVGTSLIARGASGVVARYLQMGQSASMSRERLIGATGVAVFTIDETSGVADVYDAVGTVHRVTCHTREGSTPIAVGTPIVVTDYEVATGRYLVEENPFADNTIHREVQV